MEIRQFNDFDNLMRIAISTPAFYFVVILYIRLIVNLATLQMNSLLDWDRESGHGLASRKDQSNGGYWQWRGALAKVHGLPKGLKGDLKKRGETM